VAMTHAGGEPRWQIVSDPGAPSPPYVLAQLSQDRTAGRFPLAIWSGAAIRNGEVSVAFKTVSGAIDQAAGIVWRYQDPNNYTLCVRTPWRTTSFSTKSRKECVFRSLRRESRRAC